MPPASASTARRLATAASLFPSGGADPRYDFTFTYSNGDSYTGYVYALDSYGYSLGYTQDVTGIEGGLTGRYQITNVDANDPSTPGQVFVTGYTDSENGATYSLSNNNLFPADPNNAYFGANYLSSESGYIIRSDFPDFQFGGGYYEADRLKDLGTLCGEPAKPTTSIIWDRSWVSPPSTS